MENTKDKIDTEEKEEEEVALNVEEMTVNEYESAQSDHVFIAPLGFGQIFLKSSLYVHLKGPKALKSKLQVSNPKNKQARAKTAVEVFQFSDNNQLYSVILPSQSFTAKCYSPLTKIVFETLKPKKITVFDSINAKQLLRVGKSDKEASLFCLKNSIQLQMNLFVPCPELIFPNSLRGISAYFFTAAEAKKLPCLALIGVPSESKASLSSLSVFSQAEAPYEVFRTKLTKEYLSTNKVDLELAIFRKFNENLTNLFT